MEWDKIWSFNKKVIDPIAYLFLDKQEICTSVMVKLCNWPEFDLISAEICLLRTVQVNIAQKYFLMLCIFV